MSGMSMRNLVTGERVRSAAKTTATLVRARHGCMSASPQGTGTRGSTPADQTVRPGYGAETGKERMMIRKLAAGGYRLYARKVDPKTGRRRNLGTFKTRAAAEKHEREVQYFKRH